MGVIRDQLPEQGPQRSSRFVGHARFGRQVGAHRAADLAHASIGRLKGCTRLAPDINSVQALLTTALRLCEQTGL